jgi:hypothetical protein
MDNIRQPSTSLCCFASGRARLFISCSRNVTARKFHKQALRQNTDLTKERGDLQHAPGKLGKSGRYSNQSRNCICREGRYYLDALDRRGAYRSIAVTRYLMNPSLIDCKVFIALAKLLPRLSSDDSNDCILIRTRRRGLLRFHF